MSQNKLDPIKKELLMQVADLHEVPEGAYSLRIDGQLYGKNSSANITIEKKNDLPGIDIYIKEGTKNESVHIPVLLAQSGLRELVYNDFHIGADCDVTIVAGCGIHNGGDKASEHSGIHRFFLGKNARVKYVEKHYGSGDGNGERIMNPTTEAHLDEGAYMEMQTAQIKGVDSTIRDTKADLKASRRRSPSLRLTSMVSIAERTWCPARSQRISQHRNFCPASTEITVARDTPSATLLLWTTLASWQCRRYLQTIPKRHLSTRRLSERSRVNSSSSLKLSDLPRRKPRSKSSTDSLNKYKSKREGIASPAFAFIYLLV